MSLTVTVKLQVDLLPAESVAATVTVVVPFGKTDPEVGLETTVRLEQLSVVHGVAHHRGAQVRSRRGDDVCGTAQDGNNRVIHRDRE